MIERTIYLVGNGNRLAGIAVYGAPTAKDRSSARTSYSFVRGDSRITVMSVYPDVTVELARQFAINLYFGVNTTRIDLNCDRPTVNSARTDGFRGAS